jgi:hypothetical protein
VALVKEDAIDNPFDSFIDRGIFKDDIGTLAA